MLRAFPRPRLRTAAASNAVASCPAFSARRIPASRAGQAGSACALSAMRGPRTVVMMPA
jgi:hypothetical protein